MDNDYWGFDEATQRSFIATEVLVGYQEIDPETDAPVGMAQGHTFVDRDQVPPSNYT